MTDWISRNEKQNKSYAYDHEVPGSKKAMLHYKVIAVRTIIRSLRLI